MRGLALVVVASLLSIAPVRVAESQITSIPPSAPTISIPGRGPDAIDQARQRALAPIPQAPGLPRPPAEQWVAERRVFAPELGRQVIIPGHYERRVSDQQSIVPPLTVYDVGSGLSFALPGGARAPAELRQGP